MCKTGVALKNKEWRPAAGGIGVGVIGPSLPYGLESTESREKD